MTYTEEIKRELTEHIIPFWNALKDDENGGFYGFMDSNRILDKTADKGVILHSRILWFYANCYLVLGDKTCLENARHCFDFMVKHCVDKEYGGVYWSVSAAGEPVADMKHGYCQAFFIYALASYYDACGDKAVLDLAMEMFNTVEEKCKDGVSYAEAQTRKWGERHNDELSENGLIAEKTMNTTLHLIEAYTELYRVSGDKAVSQRLVFLLEFTYDKIYDKGLNRLNVFFDKDMNLVGDIHSYGHDIEAAWLLDRACEITGSGLPAGLTDKISSVCKSLTEKIAEVAFDGNALNYESDSGKVNTWRVWWVEAEAVVGFLNGGRVDKAKGLWEYIKAYIIDKREGGEWHSQVDKNGIPDAKPVVDEWKCPYHNGRMCLEVIQRDIREF